MKTTTLLYTDGACLGNPGAGGWASILHYNDRKKILSGNEADTTNNRMELTAVIEGLSALTRPVDITIMTDSKYVMYGIDKWITNWKQNDWQTTAKRPIFSVLNCSKMQNRFNISASNWHEGVRRVICKI